MTSNTNQEGFAGDLTATNGIKRPLIVILVLLGVAVALLIWNSTRQGGIQVPDEKAVAMSLLAEKLSGPRYFNAPVSGTRDSGEPWIRLEDARLQVERVILERHWGQRQRDELDLLMSQLAEPVPARMVGGCRIPLERLNLALDAIKE